MNKLLSVVVMESRISQLKKDFKARIFAIVPNNDERATTSVLTEEELVELQNAWVQLAIWKQSDIAN
ncbi:hypothetical protein L3V77_18220 [Vibrio sp. DW001]|uniref:hypothetical protein n=1 Tax=Vibrio sp. DW001 TaxID=2912315 RepID=UPI0023AF8097|nr:hypothetical protein [Vibrio sp. DW001]WED29365.1 hypothetical protein L3V77_18220 [Vibrio sp. DW001]